MNGYEPGMMQMTPERGADRGAFPELLTPTLWIEVMRTYSLTPQELMLLRLLCSGLANKELADRLEIAYPTVRSHLRSIYQKFNQRDRVGVLLTLVHQFC